MEHMKFKEILLVLTEQRKQFKEIQRMSEEVTRKWLMQQQLATIVGNIKHLELENKILKPKLQIPKPKEFKLHNVCPCCGSSCYKRRFYQNFELNFFQCYSCSNIYV